MARVLGFGINDYDGEVSENHRHLGFYRCWKTMIARCYKYPRQKRAESYEDCTVCEEWRSLSNFKKWYDEHYVEGWDLDKDLIVKGNRVYSPEACCFLPKEINYFPLSKRRFRGKYPIGVCYLKKKGKYMAQSKFNGKNYIGIYDTEMEAFMAYKQTKERHAKMLAEKWRGKIDQRAYEALINFQVDIKD